MRSVAERHTRLMFMSEDKVRDGKKSRRIVMEVSRDGYTADVRLEGTRKRYPVSFAGIYIHAVKISVEKQRAEKKAAKGKNRAGR